MVLVDTNIWIDFLNSNKDVKPLQSLIDNDEALKHIFIEAELRTGNKYNTSFLALFSSLKESNFIPFTIIFNLIEKEKLFGKGLSFIDIAIYSSAKIGNHSVWTKDKNLKNLCHKNGIMYK